MIRDLSEEGVDCLICIHPHSSDKLKEVASQRGIDTHLIDPFKSNDTINPYKLGLESETAATVLKTLQPFVEHFNKEKAKYDKVVLISPDDGAEKAVEDFRLACGLTWNEIGYRSKSRDTMTDSNGMYKSFSLINPETVESNDLVVIIDDMVDSGGTVEKIAKEFKKKGVERVEEWCSHVVGSKKQKLQNLEYLDKIVALDTVIHNNLESMRVEYIPASAHLLASEVYKAHMKLDEQRNQ